MRRELNNERKARVTYEEQLRGASESYNLLYLKYEQSRTELKEVEGRCSKLELENTGTHQHAEEIHLFKEKISVLESRLRLSDNELILLREKETNEEHNAGLSRKLELNYQSEIEKVDISIYI